MKTKGLIFVSCLAAGALIASPAMGKPAKKSSVSKSKRMAPQTTQVIATIAIIKTLALARAAPATTAEPVTVARALTRAGNMLGRVTTAAHAITATIMGRYALLLRRWILPVLRLLLGLAVLELGLRHILGILPVLVLWRLSVQWLQQHTTRYLYTPIRL